ncbi:MAG: helix-turn-helix domain-containing protein [Microbacterium sp.]|jgi:hypothetical protein|uniref:helix-turn-helix domain-containing protein n=1 Tax=Microbacterium sp. TaxID=51671 RepID=UPI0028250CC2|nr:helix-turn-helix domain-containing protein [Microbacterium sp.]MDR2321434.1 helix-turn-helix domain-containing protein [Microbacterium sp.]
MSASARGAVELRDLIGARELDGLTMLHLVSERSPVRDVALVTDFEDIGAVGPDTVVLLSPGGARGGWMISAALRYAWERRACALIVPEQPFTASVVELARRLEVSLLTTHRDMTRLAIDAAIRLGTARAETMARVHAVVERLAGAADPSEAVALLSEELDAAGVWIESAGVRTFGSVPGRTEPAPATATQLVRTSLAPRSRGMGILVARLPAAMVGFGEQLLAEAAPSIRALLLEQRVAATRDSLPTIAITALTGSPMIGDFLEPDLGAGEGPAALPLDGAFVAICLRSEEPARIGALVHQLWYLAFRDHPLTRFDGGWFGILPAPDPESLDAQIDRVRTGFVRAAGLPLSGGASRRHHSRAEARDAVREAWLAARLADPGPDAAASEAFLEFDRITASVIGRLVPVDLAEQLVAALFPRLSADPAAPQVIDALLARAAARGSLTVAADRLGVHRNTLKARLRRAEELGLALTDPAEVLPVHLLLSAVHRPEERSRTVD